MIIHVILPGAALRSNALRSGDSRAHLESPEELRRNPQGIVEILTEHRLP